MLWCSSICRQQPSIIFQPYQARSARLPWRPVRLFRDLGICIDSGLTMQANVTETALNCFALLRNTCSIRRSVIKLVLLSLEMTSRRWLKIAQKTKCRYSVNHCLQVVNSSNVICTDWRSHFRNVFSWAQRTKWSIAACSRVWGVIRRCKVITIRKSDKIL